MGNDSNSKKYEEYKEGFEKFNKYINNINDPAKNPESDTHEGYLVNYKQYKNFKSLIDDLQNKKDPNNSDKDIKDIESKKLKTESLDKIKEQVLNDYSFIIINKNLYELICEQNTKEIHKIEYKIIHGYPGYIILKQGQGKVLQFTNNKTNIIDISNIISQKNNINKQNNNLINNDNKNLAKWEIIYKEAKNYYNNEIFFEKELIKKEMQAFHGFLIDKHWIENWKIYSFYDVIKQNIILQGINNPISIKEKITKEQNKKQFNYDNIFNDIENNIIKDEDQILKIPSTNKLYVLVNANFLKNYPINSNYKPINFNVGNYKVEVNLLNGVIITFKTTCNIINFKNNEISLQSQKNINTNENNNIYNSELLKHLIMFYFFKEELKRPTKLSMNKLNSAILINKKVIENLKKCYNLDNIISFLKKKNLLNGIDVLNCEQKYSELSLFLIY